MESTATWLRELGAVRPMAPAGREVLVLGKWVENHYPILWQRVRDHDNKTWYDDWFIYGVKSQYEIPRCDIERIMRALGIEKPNDDERAS